MQAKQRKKIDERIFRHQIYAAKNKIKKFFFFLENLPVTDGKGRAVVNELPRWWLRNPACAEALLCHEGN